MAKENKPKTEQQPAETTENILTTTAKKIGTAAGRIAAALGATAEHSAGGGTAPLRKVAAKVRQLPKKDKSRLPRREKKARQKAGTL